MAALRRGISYLSFFRSTTHILFSSWRPAVQRFGKWTNILCTSLTVGGTLCAIPFKQVENLSHDSLIRRAAALVTDSSSTFLSQTTLALIDAVTEYSKAVHTLIALQRRYLASLGKLTPAEEDSVWQVIIGQRAEVNDRREECERFESTWVSAVNLCEMSAEAAYTSGAEQACITAKTNIQVAQSQVEEIRKLAADADKQLADTKVMEVERMAQYTASLENSNDEEEVPEAYLRED
ncbi:diablo homolog, mitochondrial [Sphaeramia orbicularis]|uniref:Direct IAP-binding protein with low pI n=1 Tax=Sphaeramia orbicularis TaxID=375764 RepID=A0A672YE65_9TELE|nr:diablo homolog, mitochondrial [Sphaeramia orbicularis]